MKSQTGKTKTPETCLISGVSDGSGGWICRILHGPGAPARLCGVSRILVVDDEPDVAELVEIVLRSKGHDVETLHSGCAALEWLATGAYELIVCDLHMPDVHGQAVYETIRNPPRRIPPCSSSRAAMARTRSTKPSFARGTCPCCPNRSRWRRCAKP
jgi:CheY-like chemotaxis protein